MKRIIIIVLILMAMGVFSVVTLSSGTKLVFLKSEATSKEIVQLPQPRFESTTSCEEAILKRRSVRYFKDEPLTMNEVSQLLWAAQGISNEKTNFRTAPSAGALYPLELYIIVGDVESLKKGVYKYNPKGHHLINIQSGDKRVAICNAALGQSFIKKAAIIIVFTAVYERTTKKYGERGIRYVHIEVGHAAQNVYLQAVSLNLGTVAVGAFHDNEVRKILNLPEEEHPLYIMPVGRI